MQSDMYVSPVGGVSMRTSPTRGCASLASVAVALFSCISVAAHVANDSVTDPNSHSVGASPDVNDLRWDLAKAFTFCWTSVELSAQMGRATPDGVGEANLPLCTLTVSGKVDWTPIETQGLVIIDVSAPQICELLDDYGNSIAYKNAQSDRKRDYQDRHWYWTDTGAYLWTTDCDQFKLKGELCVDTYRSLPSTLSRVAGYIWAIYADAVVCVDVPFDPNYGSLESEVVPDLTFVVDPTMPPAPQPVEYARIPLPGTGGAMVCRAKRAMGVYQYGTWLKSKMGRPVFRISEGIRYPGHVYAYGDYAIVRTELYDSTEGVFTIPIDQGVVSSVWDTRGSYCWGQTKQIDDDVLFDTVRHVILVHPVEVKIPFVLKNVSVPIIAGE